MRKPVVDLAILQDTPPWDWPDEARDLLLSALRDGRAPLADRIIATELAGDPAAMDAEVSQALLRVAWNPGEPERLRGKALIALGPVLELDEDGDGEDPEDALDPAELRRIREDLQALHGDPGVPLEVRRRALEAAVRSPRPWQRDAVREAFASGVPAWRLTAVFCMRYLRGFDAEIGQALQDPSPDLRLEALQAAGEWGLEAAWPLARGIVSRGGPASPLLLAAIDAVARIRPGEAEDLLEDLADSDDEEVAEAVWEALAGVRPGDEDAVEED